MCRGDGFGAAELPALWTNPILRPLLEKLVFIDDQSAAAGYPAEGGMALRTAAGKSRAVGGAAVLRLAASGGSAEAGELGGVAGGMRGGAAGTAVQAGFPGVVSADGGGTEGGISTRYEGRVQAAQAMALLGPRGWVNDPEAGVFKVFRGEGLMAWIEFDTVFQSAREAGEIRVEGVYFRKRQGGGDNLKLADIPPRVFSEVMRDVDLIVAVAAASGMVPEASMSTVEFRRMVLGQLCTWMKMGT